MQPLFTRYIYTLNGLLDLGLGVLLWSGEKRFFPLFLVKNPGNDLYVRSRNNFQNAGIFFFFTNPND